MKTDPKKKTGSAPSQLQKSEQNYTPAPNFTPANQNYTPAQPTQSGSTKPAAQPLNYTPTQTSTPAAKKSKEKPNTKINDTGQNYTPANQNFTPSAPEQQFSPSSPEQQFSPGGLGTGLYQQITKKNPVLPEQVGSAPTGLQLFTIPASGAIKIVSDTSKLKSLETIGKIGKVDESLSAATTAATFATNSATKAKTASWLAKLAKSTTNPAFVVSTLMGAIGSYPFAGFIKEEALQTLGFSVKSALDNKDISGAEQAITLQKEILNPDIWSEIKSKIPFVNIVDQLDNFYESARLKLAVDEKVVSDLKIQIETGETSDEKWTRINQEQADQEKQSIDYYNQERKKMFAWENEAKEQQRNEDARYWAQQREKQNKLEEEERKATADFWEQYKKRAQKLADDSRPSKLNFGLL